MFGMDKCVYYECSMNGSSGSFEQLRRPTQDMCPVCLGKLKAFVKFDTRERYEKLIQVCKVLGFQGT